MDLFEESPGDNAPEFSVSEIAGRVRRLIEGELSWVRVRGEVGRVVLARSGHLYFDLKDDRSVLSCMTWKGQIGAVGTMPEEGMEVVVEGKAEPRAHVFVGQYDADTDDEGNFRIVLLLTHDGANGVTVKAKDAAGNVGSDSIKVYYDGKEEPKEQEFWAKQKYGSCGENPAYDKWYGEGTPGTEIWIGNEWGSNTTTIGKNGGWDLKVTFPDMPCGTHAVVLETSEGVRKVYEFTRLCDGEGGHGEGGGEGGHDK